MRTTTIALAAVLLASCASMADRGKPLELYQETSAVGEPQDAFVLRIAPRALQASRDAYGAICGELIGAGPYTVQFRTDHRTDSCAAPDSGGTALLVNGLAADARDGHFAIDNRRPGYLVTPWVVKFQGRGGVRSVGEPGR